jgi:hypothetical protein
MEDSQKPIARLIAREDYVHVVCATCDGVCELDFKGLKASIPLLEIRCLKCGDLGTWKLERAGIGFYHLTK